MCESCNAHLPTALLSSWFAVRWPLAVPESQMLKMQSLLLSDYWILFFSCFRAGLILVGFRGTYGNELDKSQKFLKMDLKSQCESKPVGNAGAVLRAKGEHCWEEKGWGDNSLSLGCGLDRRLLSTGAAQSLLSLLVHPGALQLCCGIGEHTSTWVIVKVHSLFFA